MQSITYMHLGPRLRRLIQKVCTYQIKSLQAIVNDDAMDTTIYETNNELPTGSIHPLALESINSFQRVYNDPCLLPTLDDENLSIFKHILFNFIPDHRYPFTKPKLWRKIFRMEKFTEVFGLN